MLLTLLPGLRELRTPVTIGYIYLLAIILTIGDRFPSKDDLPAPLEPLSDIAEWLGKPALLGASVFAAYLLGSLLEISAGTVASLLSWFRGSALILMLSFPRISSWRDEYLRAKHLKRLPPAQGDPNPHWRRNLHWPYRRKVEIETAHGKEIFHGGSLLSSGSVYMLVRYARDRIPDANVQVTPAYRILVEDLYSLRTRLFMASTELYADYDRLAAEADLKVNVGISGILFCWVASSSLSDPRWLLVCAPLVLLIRRGFNALRGAGGVMVQAIIAHVVTSPKFEAFVESSTRPEDIGYR